MAKFPGIFLAFRRGEAWAVPAIALPLAIQWAYGRTPRCCQRDEKSQELCASVTLQISDVDQSAEAFSQKLYFRKNLRVDVKFPTAGGNCKCEWKAIGK